MSRILITGASGFIGRHVVGAIADKHEVHALTRTRPTTRGSTDHRAVATEGGAGVVWHEADLLGLGEAERCAREVAADMLLHLAWYAAPGKFWTAPENERWIDASLRLLRAFAESGGRSAVMAGTCAEYAWGDDVLREDSTPLAPTTLYGACKHATHVAARAVARQLDVSLAWGRIFFLYGPGEPQGRLVSSLASGLLGGRVVPTSDGHQRRDYMHVRDVAGAIVALMESDTTGTVNIATGTGTPVRELVRLVGEAAGVPERIRFGALPLQAGEPDAIVGDARRLIEEVGFRPRVSMREGIRETVEWWRTELSAGEATAPTRHGADSGQTRRAPGLTSRR